MGAGAVAFSALGAMPATAYQIEDVIASMVGDAPVTDGGIDLIVPEIAENGSTVPVEVVAPGAVMIRVFSDKNPEPDVATFKFGPLNPTQRASTRIRLATTQNVIAIAQMADGSFHRVSANVKVTIGGCGG